MKKRELLPHCPDAERALLGAVLLDNAAWPQVAALSPGEFYLDSHQKIFATIQSLFKAGTPADLVTVAEELKRSAELEAMGGASYISSLTDGLPRLNNVTHYVRLVKEKALLRRLVYASQEIAKRAREGPENVADLLAWARSEIPQATSSNGIAAGVLLSQVEPERVKWLWRNRIPLSKITMLDGDPGLGKSLLALEIAARLSRGQSLHGDDPRLHGGSVILTAEDGLADTVAPRLVAAGADRNRIVALKYAPDKKGEKTVSNIPVDLPTIEAAIERVGAKLVIVDVLMAYLPSDTNSYRDQDVRLALTPLAEMADRAGVAVICIRHLTKAPGGSPLYRGGGSIGIIGGARAGLLVARDPEDPSLIVLAQTKSNLGPPAPSLAYRIEANSDGVPYIAWKGESQQTASLLLAATAGDEEERGALAEAKEFLQQELESGPMKQTELKLAWRKAGIADATIRRAKMILGALSRKEGVGKDGYWLWELREKAKGAHIRNMNTLGKNGNSDAGLTPEESDAYSKLFKGAHAKGAQEPMSTLRDQECVEN
ncbi:MAG: hypothetical protein A3G20_00120 [Acidobacteria bacterium RIFCSPLOWO2_12_FULL_59_11]|nr:MAG: hypothetical protein A3G20_00120 [Acidobacteria bacterium RIFCSPLOWO2_12_FULL_59_11]